MVIIEKLQDRPTHFDSAATKADQEQLPTFKKFFLDVLGASTAEGGEQAIAMFTLGQKIYKAASDVDLEDAEFSLLLDKCKKNALRWMAHYHAQVVILLQEAEKGRKK